MIRKSNIIKGMLAIILLAASTLPLFARAQVRIKDISSLSGNREYQLIGYGLVTGLNGTGDKSRISIEMVRGMMQKMGLDVEPAYIATKNVAAVIVTAMLPSYGREGESFNVTVSSLGDATSLQGGVLLPTLLKGGDGNVYAVAQGQISLGGFESRQNRGSGNIQKNHQTVGIISGGAIMERGVNDKFARNGKFSILLHKKDPTLTKQIKELVDKRYGYGWANIINPGEVQITIPLAMRDDPVSFAANIEEMTLTVDEPNRVVINERTGTVIVGNKVRISRVAISHNGIRIAIDETAPAGNTTSNRRRGEEKTGSMVSVQGETTVNDLVTTLNALGASPKDLIAIFQAIYAAGALHGELKIM